MNNYYMEYCEILKYLRTTPNLQSFDAELINYVGGNRENHFTLSVVDHSTSNGSPILDNIADWIESELADIPSTHILALECHRHVSAHGTVLIEGKIYRHGRKGNLEAITVSVNHRHGCEAFFVIMFARDDEARSYMDDFSLGFDTILNSPQPVPAWWPTTKLAQPLQSQ